MAYLLFIPAWPAMVGGTVSDGSVTWANVGNSRISDGIANDDDPTWSSNLAAKLNVIVPTITVSAGFTTPTSVVITVLDELGNRVNGATISVVPPQTSSDIPLTFSPLSGTTVNGQFALTAVEPFALAQSYEFPFSVTAVATQLSAATTGIVNVLGLAPLVPLPPPPGTPDQRLPVGAKAFSQRQKVSFSRQAVQTSVEALTEFMQASLKGYALGIGELGYTALTSPIENATAHLLFEYFGGAVLSPGVLLDDANDFLKADKLELESISELRNALDPPDPNYTVVAFPSVQTPPALPVAREPLSANTAGLMSQGLGLKVTIQAFLDALYVSVNRYTSALAAGDLTSAKAQRDVILKYEDALVVLYQSDSNNSQDLVTSFKQDGLPNLVWSAQDATNVQSLIRANGLPSQLIAFLQERGTSQPSLFNIQHSLITSEQAALVGDSFSLLQHESQAYLAAAAAFIFSISFMVAVSPLSDRAVSCSMTWAR
jgi:hypothetical protein